MNKQEQRIAIAEFCGETNKSKWLAECKEQRQIYLTEIQGHAVCTNSIQEALQFGSKSACEDFILFFEKTDCEPIEHGFYSIDNLPDYLHDLNAIHEAELKLSRDQHTEFREWLNTITYRSCSIPIVDNERVFISSTASQRAEALLHAVGKWKD